MFLYFISQNPIFVHKLTLLIKIRYNCFDDILLMESRTKPMTLEEQHQLLLKLCVSYQKKLENHSPHFGADSNDQKIKKLEKISAINALIEALAVEANPDFSNEELTDEADSDCTPTELIGQAINNFKVKFSTSKKTLSTHRDSDTLLFLKNVGFGLSSLALGLGLAISYARKNSCEFWKSNGEILCESLTKVIDTELTDDSLQPS